MYPPHHLGGYELVWCSAMKHLRESGHTARVLTSDFRRDTDEADEPGTFRELRWYWRDHKWPSFSWPERIALERYNHAALRRHLHDLHPDVVGWWAMGGMSLALIEQVRRAGIPAVAFVHDDWLAYGPRVDQWIRSFVGRPRLAAVAERLIAVPTRVDLESAARYVFVSETVRAHTRTVGLHLQDSSIAHSGVDRRFFLEPSEHPWRWSLLYVGRIDERKGVADAVRALERLPAEASLTLVGDGERAELLRLRALAVKLGLGERVHEAG